MASAIFDSLQTNQLAVNDTGTIIDGSVGLLNAGTVTSTGMTVNTLLTTTYVNTPVLQTTLVEAPASDPFGAVMVRGTGSSGDILFETGGSIKASIDAVSGGLLRRDLVINQTPGLILTAEQSGATVLLTSGPVFLPPASDGLTFKFIIVQDDLSISINTFVGNTITGIGIGGATPPTYFDTTSIVPLNTLPGPVIGASVIFTASGTKYNANSVAIFWAAAP
jgi:hypothetical protein